MAVIDAGNSIAADVSFPASVDWVAFDCYGCEGALLEDWLNNHLKPQLTPNQRIFFAPYAYYARRGNYNGSTYTTPAEQAEVNQRTEYYVKLALQEPLCVALLAFLGHTSADPANHNADIGVFDMPDVKAKYTFMMRALGFGTP